MGWEHCASGTGWDILACCALFEWLRAGSGLGYPGVMSGFLFWIGAYNALGAVIVMAMHFDVVADVVLRRVTEVVEQPYRHEGYARMWMWWAAMVNLFMGLVMVRAAGWPAAVQREVAVLAVGVYIFGWLCVVFGLRRPRYGRGIYALHPLWLGQAGWGAWAVWQAG